jgi:hypothetical protein
MDNMSIYAGVSAHPAREIAEALHGGGWDFSDGLPTRESFLALVGAVTTLARTVDQQGLNIARLNASLRAVAEVQQPAVQSTGAHALSPATVDALRAQRLERKPPDAARRLELVTIGLRELLNMIENGRMGANTVDALDGVLIAAITRLDAMLDALEG